jgi:hypothetical protein
VGKSLGETGRERGVGLRWRMIGVEARRARHYGGGGGGERVEVRQVRSEKVWLFGSLRCAVYILFWNFLCAVILSCLLVLTRLEDGPP